MRKSTAPTLPPSDNGTHDRDNVLDLLGHIPAQPLPAGLNKEVALELGEIVTQIAEAAAIATMAEAAIVAACHTAGMEAVMLEACRRRGLRKGRRAFAVAMRDYLVRDPLVPPEESAEAKE